MNVFKIIAGWLIGISIPSFCASVSFASSALTSGSIGSLTVVQVNIENGGSLTNGRDGVASFDTARRWARLMASASLSDAAMIGMQEIGPSDPEAEKILLDTTHLPWKSIRYAQGGSAQGSGFAIFYRADRVELIEDLGTVTLGRIDNGYEPRFGGGIFRELSSGKRFGFFTGKLIWAGAVMNGSPVTEAERVREARIVQSFVSEKMSVEPSSARILAMDMNAGFQSLTHAAWLQAGYADGGASSATFDSHWNLLFGKRLDYIWMSSGSGNPATFLEPPHRSEDFGSDHRMVWVRVAI